MLDENLILILSQNVMKRYEPKVNGGAMFLYNPIDESFWVGNCSTKSLIEALDGHKSLKEIYMELNDYFPNHEYEVVRQSYEVIVEELLEKNFLQTFVNCVSSQ